MNNALETVPTADNEEERLEVVEDKQLLCEQVTDEFDHLTSIASRFFEVPIALVTLIKEERQLFTGSTGIDEDSTPREDSFCTYAVNNSKGEIMEVPNATEDSRFESNPLVTGKPHIRAYLGAPIVIEDDFVLGNFCLIDREPREFTSGEKDDLRLFASEVAEKIELQTLRRREKLASIGEMAASMMHEINNPNGIIQGNVDFLDRIWEQLQQELTESQLSDGLLETLQQEVPDSIQEIRNGSGRIKDIIDNVQHFARLGDRSLGEPHQINGIRELVREVVRDHSRRLSGDTEVNLSLDLESKNYELLMARRDLKSILSNLLQNAVEAVRDEDSPSVTVRVSEEVNRLCLEVTDDGGGIPDEIQENLTDPFFTTKVDTGGTGLGLSIVETLVSEARGSLSIDSEDDVGTSVKCVFPLTN